MPRQASAVWGLELLVVEIQFMDSSIRRELTVSVVRGSTLKSDLHILRLMSVGSYWSRLMCAITILIVLMYVDCQSTMHILRRYEGCKECNGSSIYSHKVSGVSEPHSLLYSRSPKNENRTKGQDLRWQCLSLLYSFDMGKEVCRVCLQVSYEYFARARRSMCRGFIPVPPLRNKKEISKATLLWDVTSRMLDRDKCMHIQHLCIANEVRCGKGLARFLKSPHAG